MKVLILLIIMINTAFAQSTILNKGDIAPYSGILLTKDRAEKAVKAEKANIVLSDLRIAEEELTEYHRSDARRARTELSKSQIKGYLNVLGAFTLGVLAASFAFKVNQKVGDI
jgi:hypothetical protein